MKLSDTDEFQHIAFEMIDLYRRWEELIKNPRTKRAMMAVSALDVCVMVFRGTEEDCFDIKKFLEKKDRKK